jgi:hypothetical protein
MCAYIEWKSVLYCTVCAYVDLRVHYTTGKYVYIDWYVYRTILYSIYTHLDWRNNCAKSMYICISGLNAYTVLFNICTLLVFICTDALYDTYFAVQSLYVYIVYINWKNIMYCTVLPWRWFIGRSRIHTAFKTGGCCDITV